MGSNSLSAFARGGGPKTGAEHWSGTPTFLFPTDNRERKTDNAMAPVSHLSFLWFAAFSWVLVNGAFHSLEEVVSSAVLIPGGEINVLDTSVRLYTTKGVGVFHIDATSVQDRSLNTFLCQRGSCEDQNCSCEYILKVNEAAEEIKFKATIDPDALSMVSTFSWGPGIQGVDENLAGFRNTTR